MYEEAIKTAADGEDFYTNLIKIPLSLRHLAQKKLKQCLIQEPISVYRWKLRRKEAKRGHVASQEIKQTINKSINK